MRVTNSPLFCNRHSNVLGGHLYPAYQQCIKPRPLHHHHHPLSGETQALSAEEQATPAGAPRDKLCPRLYAPQQPLTLAMGVPFGGCLFTLPKRQLYLLNISKATIIVGWQQSPQAQG